LFAARSAASASVSGRVSKTDAPKPLVFTSHENRRLRVSSLVTSKALRPHDGLSVRFVGVEREATHLVWWYIQHHQAVPLVRPEAHNPWSTDALIFMYAGAYDCECSSKEYRRVPLRSECWPAKASIQLSMSKRRSEKWSRCWRMLLGQGTIPNHLRISSSTASLVSFHSLVLTVTISPRSSRSRCVLTRQQLLSSAVVSSLPNSTSPSGDYRKRIN